MLAILFDAAGPASCGGPDVLRPLWAEEAMHRSANLLQLALALERLTWNGIESEMTGRLEYALAEGLAASYRSLDIGRQDELLSCNETLRAVVANLVALFGPTVGEISLKTDLMRLSLPAYKRRALVLVASELVINALKHAFPDRQSGRIAVALGRVDAATVRLAVEDDGRGFALLRPGTGLAIVGGLAGLLEADLVYRRSALGGTAAEFQLPAR
jgi:two-component sensor histidine kinase